MAERSADDSLYHPTRHTDMWSGSSWTVYQGRADLQPNVRSELCDTMAVKQLLLLVLLLPTIAEARPVPRAEYLGSVQAGPESDRLNLLLNNSFEDGLLWWTWESTIGRPPATICGINNPPDGDCFLMGGGGISMEQYIYQEVYVKDMAEPMYGMICWQVVTDEATPYVWDTAEVFLGNSYGDRYLTFREITNLDARGYWTCDLYKILDLAGNFDFVDFVVHTVNDYFGPTWFFYDVFVLEGHRRSDLESVFLSLVIK